MKWTDKEADMLRKLGEKGYTLTEISNSGIFKSRSRESLANASRALGISLAGPPPEIDYDAYERMMKKMRKPKCV